MTTSDTRHLSPEEMTAYQRRRLAPGDLLRVDDHLARCETCRGRLGGAERLGRAVGAIRADLESAVEPFEHPALEPIAAYVDGDLEEVERELIESHLAVCSSCAEDVAGLRAMRDPVTGPAPEARLKRSRGWLGYGVVAAVAAGLAGFVVWTGIQPAPAPGDEPGRAERAAVEPPPAGPAAPPTLTLNDGGSTVTLSADGRVRGLPPLADEDAEGIRLALEEGRVRLPALIGDLRGVSGTLMSGASEAPAFRLIRPLATGVETDRPAFEWTPLQHSTAYVVAVFDLAFNKVAESQPLAASVWQPPAPLARGRTYVWQVRALRGDEAIVAPAPPAPEARFRVLSQVEADRLADLRGRYGDFHLVRGILLAQAGSLDEAERELASLVEANPGIAEAQRLLDSLREQRKELSRR
jgi:anti-sigma factor RsiW